jgi:hypothetical protein
MVPQTFLTNPSKLRICPYFILCKSSTQFTNDNVVVDELSVLDLHSATQVVSKFRQTLWYKSVFLDLVC